MLFHLQSDSKIPPSEQIVAQVIFAIASGALEVGSLLPSIRELGPQIQVHPNTVAKAYQELERLGAIVARRGPGVYPGPALLALGRPAAPAYRLCPGAAALL